jgi:hypothetical protein
MVNLLFLFPIITFWHSLANEITKYKSTDMANNSISFLHCLLYIVHYHYEYNLDYMLHISIGYYIYDLLYQITLISRYKTSTINELAIHGSFILHHLFGIYLIVETFTSDYKMIRLAGYNLMEVSNIMLYVSYYITPSEYGDKLENTSIIILSDLVYFLWYAYFRVVLFSNLIYENLHPFFELSILSQTVIAMLYFMGVAWSCKLFADNVRNII